MQKRLTVASLVLIIFMVLLLSAAIPTAFGLPPSQDDATHLVQTVEAFVTQAAAGTGTPPAQEPDARKQSQALKHLEQGWESYYLERSRDAIDEFTMAIELAPEWAEPYVARGMTYVQMDVDALAVPDFEQAIALGASDAELYAGWLGYALIEIGEFQQGIDACTQAVKLNPRYSTAYNNRAYAYGEMGRYDDAVADYTRAIQLDPTEPIYFGNRSGIYQIQDRWEDYVVDNYLDSGLTAFQDGDRGEAVANFTHAINEQDSFNPPDPVNFAYAEFNLGRVHVDFGSYDLALEAFQRAAVLAPEFAAPYAWMGKVYDAQGEDQQAFAEFDRALKIDPEYAEGYLLRAQAYDAHGQSAAATADYWEWVQHFQAHAIHRESISDGQPLTLAVEEGWAYYLPFEGQAGQIISLDARTVAGVSQDIDSLLVLLDPAGQPIAARASQDQLSHPAVLTDFVLPRGGTYTVVATHARTFSGAVSLELTLGAVMSGADLTATATWFTPTPTLTLTPTATLTPTPTFTFTPSPTFNSQAAAFVALGKMEYPVTTAITWQDNTHVILSYFQGIVRVEARNGTALPGWVVSPPYGEIQTALAVSPDGKLAASAYEDLVVLDPLTGKEKALLREHTDIVHSIAFSADSTLMASNGGDTIILWDTATFKPLGTIDTTGYWAAISPDKKWLAIATWGNEIQLWDISDPTQPGKFMTLIGEFDAGVTSGVAFSPDGSLLAGVNGRDISLWEMTTFRQVATLQGHSRQVTSLAFSPDGRLLASGSADRTVRLWSVSDRAEVANLGATTGVMAGMRGIRYVEFNPSGTRLLALDEDLNIWQWMKSGG